MNDDTLISVIIPIYNVEKYIKQCIESVLKQTYKKIEIILVDDGSPDQCGEICDEYVKRDERIRVIHKKNGGLSDARNKGLEMSSGEYVIFIDSDDYIAPTMIEKLFLACEKFDAQIATCFFERVEGKHETREKQSELQLVTKRRYGGKELLVSLYSTTNSPIAFVAWNKLYKKDLFLSNNIRYPVGKYHEDTFTTYKLIYMSTYVVVINEILYFYRVRPESITTEAFTMKRLDCLEAMAEETDFYESNDEKDLLGMAINQYCYSAIKLYHMAKKAKNLYRKEECLIRIYSDYKKFWKTNSKKVKMNVLKKLIYQFFLCAPDVVAGIYSMR